MSDQDQPDRDDRVLAGEYTLGLLSADEAAAFEARMVREPELRALYAQWAEDFTGLTDDIAPQAPPARVWQQIETGLFGTRERRSWLRRFTFWGGGIVAAAVLVLAVFLPDLVERGPVPPVDPPYVAQIASEDGSLVVQAVYDDATGSLFVDRESGGAAPGRALELWLIAGEDAPVSLGVMPQDAQSILRVADDLRGRVAGAVLAISDEPEGGSPTGAPTGDVLAVGPVQES
ncbi:anti-sigma factor [uncultured Roseovarius sp.]|uniref:anti-sigma factor n=1 Tax=uncultured Roseovarius sp. TaxID=293344 RepID=UPI002623642E|nr:anti-sigma factor [uncultured Roseovarius sp.]